MSARCTSIGSPCAPLQWPQHCSRRSKSRYALFPSAPLSTGERAVRFGLRAGEKGLKITARSARYDQRRMRCVARIVGGPFSRCEVGNDLNDRPVRSDGNWSNPSTPSHNSGGATPRFAWASRVIVLRKVAGLCYARYAARTSPRPDGLCGKDPRHCEQFR